MATTLDANSETATVSVQPGQNAVVTIAITGTITVTPTVAINGETGVPMINPATNANAAYTASTSMLLLAPGVYTYTASGVSGGSAVIDSVSYTAR